MANAQIWAITIRLKMPTHRKYAMPMCRPALRARRNSTMCDTKKIVTHCTSCTRFTREAKAP